MKHLTCFYAGLPSNAWKVWQQIGRAGRNGQQAVSLTIYWAGQRKEGEEICSI